MAIGEPHYYIVSLSEFQPKFESYWNVRPRPKAAAVADLPQIKAQILNQRLIRPFYYIDMS